MADPQTPGPAGTPQASGLGRDARVPVPPRNDASVWTGDLGQLNQPYPWGRVQRNDDGSLDEIVVDGGVAHLEQSSAGSWCLSITRPDLAVTVWLSTPHTELGQATAITARWEIGPGTDGLDLQPGGTTNVAPDGNGTTNGPGGTP